MTAMINLRAAGADILDVNTAERIITVVAVPYDEPAEVPYRGQVWRETFRPGAFAGLDGIDPGSIRVCREHDRSDVVGRVVRFDTSSALGLITEIRIANTERGTDTLILASEGMLSASVGFLAAPSGVHLDHATRTRTVVRAQLDHIGLVMTPAYAGARVLAARSTTPNLDKFRADPVLAWAEIRCAGRRR